MQTKSETAISNALKNLFVPNPALLNVTPPPSNPETGELSALNLFFLDVDGVLNGAYIQAAFATLPFPDVDSSTGYVHDAHAIDPIAPKLINLLCKSTGSFIVLSSSWRIGFDMPSILKMLETLGIDPSLVIGRTDVLPGGDTTVRGDQIKRFTVNIVTEEGRAFMFKNDMLRPGLKFEDKVVVQAYAIVDDDDDMLEEQKGNFVQTTFLDGLKLSHVLELGKILSNDETFYLNRLVGLPPVGNEAESKFH